MIGGMSGISGVFALKKVVINEHPKPGEWLTKDGTWSSHPGGLSTNLEYNKFGKPKHWTGNRKEVAGKTQNWMKAKVFDYHTGKEIKHVISADESTGRIVRFAVDKRGNFKHINNGIEEETEYRSIRIDRLT